MSIGLFVAGAAIPIYRGRGFTGEAVLAFTSEDDDHMSAFGDANMWRSDFNGETKTHDVDLGPGARADFVTWGELQNWHMVYEKMRREQPKTTFWAENIFKKFALDIGMRLFLFAATWASVESSHARTSLQAQRRMRPVTASC